MASGEDIPVSIATSSPIETDPLENADTFFIFGNADDPNATGDNTPSQSSTATAATGEGGPVSAGGSPAVSGPGTSAGTAAASSGGLSIWLILALAAAAIFLIHHFAKK